MNGVVRNLKIHGVCYAEINFFSYIYLPCVQIKQFRLLQNLYQTGLWIICLLFEYQISMGYHRLIHGVNKPFPKFYFYFQFFFWKVDDYLDKSLFIQIKSILMINIPQTKK